MSANSTTLVNRAVPGAGTYVTDGYYTGRLAQGARYLAVQSALTYGAGGTTIKAYLQTTFDDEASWIDVMSFAFATATAKKVSAITLTTALAAAITPTDGALTDNTILSGLLGNKIRVKYVVVGTYTDSTLRVDAVLR